MARGFESKAIADQQQSAEEQRRAVPDDGTLDPARITRRRQLELGRADVERRLAVAVAPAHRQILERALRALDADLADLV